MVTFFCMIEQHPTIKILLSDVKVHPLYENK